MPLESCEREIIIGYSDAENLASIECRLHCWKKFLKKVQKNPTTTDLEFLFCDKKKCGFRARISKKAISIRSSSPTYEKEPKILTKNADFEVENE